MRSALMTCAVTIAAAACLFAQTQSDFQQDFDVAIRRIETRDDFIALLERVVDELYDPHAQLTVNLARSPRLVPSGTDLWAEWHDGRATITQVRDRSDAERDRALRLVMTQ